MGPPDARPQEEDPADLDFHCRLPVSDTTTALHTGLLALLTYIRSACGLSLARVLAWKLPGYIGKTPYDPYLRRDAFEVFYPIEITFGILGACLPMLRPILHRKEYTSRASGQSFAMGRVPTAGSQAALTNEESLIRTDNVSDGSAHSFSREVDEAVQGAGPVRPPKSSSIHRP